MNEPFKTLDVRPILQAGGEPFADIMEAVNALAPDQGLRLLATFQPKPLFAVLGRQGFSHEAQEIGDGDWEVLFRRDGVTAGMPDASPVQPAVSDDDWPAPARHLDNRDLDPPEPMVRILEELETMARGEVLEALLCREPMFLLPELAKRGHAWAGGFDAGDASTYRIRIRTHTAAAEESQP